MQDNEKSTYLLEYYKLMVPYMMQISSSHWHRHHIFLVVNVGLIVAIISSQELSFPIRFGAIIMGFLCSCLWIVASIQGRFWNKRYYHKLGELERELTGGEFKIFQYEDFTSEDYEEEYELDWSAWYHKRWSITRCSVYFSILFAAGWILLLIYYVVID